SASKTCGLSCLRFARRQSTPLAFANRSKIFLRVVVVAITCTTSRRQPLDVSSRGYHSLILNVTATNQIICDKRCNITNTTKFPNWDWKTFTDLPQLTLRVIVFIDEH